MIQADLNGELRGRVLVPSRTIAAGDRELVLTGAEGSQASAVIHFREAEGGPTEERPFNETVRPVGCAAVAETFQLPESRIVRTVSVKFCTVGAIVNPVWMQIRQTENGIPNDVILGEKVLYQPAIHVGWVDYVFNPPIPILEGSEYAIVLVTNDPGYSVAVATIGQIVLPDEGPVEGVVTEQPYQIGVLLVSSNVSTWSALQDSDLAFKIKACSFTSNTRDVTLGEVIVEDETDAVVHAIVHRPFGVADCQFTITHLGSGESHTQLEEEKVRFDARRNGTFRLTARLLGDTKASPILFPYSKLELGNVEDSGDYITAPFPAGDSFNAVIIFDSLRSGNSTIIPYVAVQRFVGPNPNVGEYDWVQLITLVTAIPIGNGWVTETWRIDDTLRGIRPDYTTRIKLHDAGAPAGRPVVKNLRCITILSG